MVPRRLFQYSKKSAKPIDFVIAGLRRRSSCDSTHQCTMHDGMIPAKSRLDNGKALLDFARERLLSGKLLLPCVSRAPQRGVAPDDEGWSPRDSRVRRANGSFRARPIGGLGATTEPAPLIEHRVDRGTLFGSGPDHLIVGATNEEARAVAGHRTELTTRPSLAASRRSPPSLWRRVRQGNAWRNWQCRTGYVGDVRGLGGHATSACGAASRCADVGVQARADRERAR